MNTEQSLVSLVTIGYAKQILKEGTRERLRMVKYATVLREFHVIIFTLKKAGFPSVQKEGNLFLHATNARTRIGMLWNAYRIGQDILNKEPSRRWVVSSQDPFETSLVGSIIARGGHITHHVQLHGDVFNPDSYKSSFLQRLRVTYGRYIVRQAGCVRVVSDRLKQSLVNMNVPEEVVSILPIQADLKNFIAAKEHRSYKKESPLSFLYVGRFSSEKNIPLIIHAFSQVIKKFPGARLTLIGEGTEQGRLVELIKSLGVENSVYIKPWTNNVVESMMGHDIFCLASNHEGWGMVMAEAAATGMPVITTNVGCAGEIVKSNYNGQIVPVGDCEAYVTAMQHYLYHPELVEVEGQRGHSIVESHSLSETEYLKKFVESYTSCL